MKENSRLECKKQVQFSLGMAAIDGGKPSAFTQNLLSQYEDVDPSYHFSSNDVYLI